MRGKENEEKRKIRGESYSKANEKYNEGGCRKSTSHNL